MKIVTRKSLYLPSLFIMAVVLALLVFISISTYRNLDRQKQIALQWVQRQGLSLVQGFEATMRIGLTMGWWNTDAAKQLIAELAINPDIAYVYLLDHNGAVLSHARSHTYGLSARDISDIRLEPHTSLEIRVRRLADDTEIYELAKPLDPLESTKIGGLPPGRGDSPMDPEQALSDGVMVLGMKMKPIIAAHQSDLHHAAIMAVIVVALGSSALFFTFVIQKYYRVNRTLRETQDYTHQVVASLATGLISIDATGRVQSYNNPALELLGMPAAALQETPLSRILDFSATGIAQTLSTGRSVIEKEIDYSPSAGRHRPLALSVSPISSQGAASPGAVILLRDLSEIKALESKVRRAEKMAAVGELAATVAHEIRNPLSSIKGFAQFLNKSCAAGLPESEYTQIMIHEVDRINAVVNDMLTFARPMTANRQPVDVNSLVAHAIRLVRADAEDRNIRIESRFEIENPIVCVDGNQLTQALLNLLLNAVTAIDRNGTIIVVVENDPRDRMFRLWVQDDGPGIDPELQEKIFEPFFTQGEKGTGLGLAIVRNIVENHDGRVTVVSPLPQSNRGSRFVIEQPCGKQNKENQA
jgi:two-component system, NtrC family, sensor histidine kinase HydH